MVQDVIIKKETATKSISELKDIRFLIEKYQRGYRWGIHEIVDLLEDILEYGSAKKQHKTIPKFYCLQPLVVKTEGSRMELIDGQQRATSLYIILTALQLPNYYSISYSTRSSSEDGIIPFLSDIANHKYAEGITLNHDNYSQTDNEIYSYWKEWVKPEDNTVDNFYFFRAYQVAKLWLKELSTLTEKEFTDTLLHDTRVIWYEKKNMSESEESVASSFLKFNDGKIGLEQAELIKSLFVLDISKEKDFTKQNYELNSFADEWNEIEHQLQNDRFWYFVSNDRYSTEEANRINLLFSIDKGTLQIDDKLSAYRKYDKDFKSENNIPKWENIGNLYSRLEEWFLQREMYHLVGTIINLQLKTINQLKDSFSSKENKKKFIKELKNIILDNFFEKDQKTFKSKFNLDLLRYGSHNNTIRTILILHNIALTHLEDPYNLFPFNRLKNIKTWTLEHIIAQNVKDFETLQEVKLWREDICEMWQEIKTEKENTDSGEFEDMLNILDECLLKKNLNNANAQVGVISKFLEDFLGLHEIDNLCLLDGVTNTKVGNSLFKRKRDIILNLDEENKLGDDAYVPIGTHHVFQKKYSQSKIINQMVYWSGKDRQAYKDNIESTIKEFLTWA